MDDKTPFGKMVYLASPYTHENREVETERFIAAVKACGWLMVNISYVQMIYSPIAHTHPIADVCTLPGFWSFWEACDKCMLSRCDEIWILTLDGWETSTGVTAERQIASEYGLKEKFVVPQSDGGYAVEAYEKKQKIKGRSFLGFHLHDWSKWEVVNRGEIRSGIKQKRVCLTCNTKQVDIEWV
jgi:hypothetical protein